LAPGSKTGEKGYHCPQRIKSRLENSNENLGPDEFAGLKKN